MWSQDLGALQGRPRFATGTIPKLLGDDSVLYDSPLNEEGLAQARELNDLLENYRGEHGGRAGHARPLQKCCLFFQPKKGGADDLTRTQEPPGLVDEKISA